MRVLHCIPNLQPGGGTRCVCDLVRHLRRADIDARICAFDGAGAQAGATAGIPDPFDLHYTGSLRDLAGLYRFRGELKRVVQEWSPDIVHSHLWPACRLSALILGDQYPQVWHIHDAWGWLKDNGLRNRAYRLATKMIRRRYKPTLIAVSEAAAVYTAEHLGWRIQDIRVIRNGVDLERFRPGSRHQSTPSDKRYVIGMASLFRPEKGHAVMIRAVRLLKDRGIHVAVRLAGEGQTLEECKCLVRSLGLDDSVSFLGLVSDMPAFLSSLDAFALPSTSCEGLPLTILEAMAMGIPVVASPVSGIPEVIQDGVNGVIVPAGDADALAVALCRLATDPALARLLAEKGLADVRERFSMDMVTRAVTHVYESIM